MWLKIVASSLVAVGGCSSQPNSLGSCSKVQAISLPTSGVYEDLKRKRLPAGWGGVLDLIQDVSRPDSSPRFRCTVHMDLVDENATLSKNLSEFAFWTAAHCLNFSDVSGAELALFDADKKTYLRLRIQIPELERFRRGVSLFEKRLRMGAQDDAQAQTDYDTYLESGHRHSVLLNGEPIIERGTPECTSDTLAFKNANPTATVICSSVLDLARVKAVVLEESLQQPGVVDALQRMRRYLKDTNDSRFALTAKITNEQDRIGHNFFLTNWRPKVTALTRWRRYAAESAMIEKVRQCGTDDQSGICAQEFRDFFSEALNEYTANWAPPPDQSFPMALKNEVYAEPLSTTNAKHNLKWLLSTQSGLGNGMRTNPALLADVKFSSNFSQQSEAPDSGVRVPVLGSGKELFYGLASPLTMYSEKPDDFPIQINAKTILVTHTKYLKIGTTFFLQPGDSGSLFLLSGFPLAVVATVDGKETSGGTAVLPLPTLTDEAEEPSSPNSSVESCK